MALKLIIFDLDDTLIDTFGSVFPPAAEHSLKAMISEGLKVDDFDRAKEKLLKINNGAKSFGEAITEFLREIGSDERFSKVGSKVAYGLDYDYDVKLLPGVLEMLDSLNVDLVVVTKGFLDSQEEKMRKAGLNEERFKDVIVVSDYDKGGPYLDVLKRFGCLPEEVLVVGDKYETDLVPASNLGMKTAWVAWGRGKDRVLKKGAVDYVVRDLREISGIVKLEV